jgi:acyl-CoA reductase-like NAD-dependent aldehyde dehydrogenase
MSTFSNSLSENHVQAAEQARETTFGTWINGATSPASSGETIAVDDPAVAEAITEVPRCQAADVHRAVGVARDTFTSR